MNAAGRQHAADAAGGDAPPWVMAQSWHDLLFAHWPVPASALAPLLPAGLQPECFQGRAWLGIVPFRMSGVRLRGMPALPWLSAFPELNVRSYVTRPDRAGVPRPGVWFFSLDAARWLAVAAARRWFGLPYFHAAMRCAAEGETIAYRSRRAGAAGAAEAEFIGRYGPVGAVRHAQAGSLEHFLTERYCLYALDRRGRLCRAAVRHEPWPLQPAQAQIERNTMATPLGLRLPPVAPLLHFARRLDVVVCSPQPLD